MDGMGKEQGLLLRNLWCWFIGNDTLTSSIDPDTMLPSSMGTLPSVCAADGYFIRMLLLCLLFIASDCHSLSLSLSQDGTYIIILYLRVQLPYPQPILPSVCPRKFFMVPAATWHPAYAAFKFILCLHARSKPESHIEYFPACWGLFPMHRWVPDTHKTVYNEGLKTDQPGKEEEEVIQDIRCPRIVAALSQGDQGCGLKHGPTKLLCRLSTQHTQEWTDLGKSLQITDDSGNWFFKK